MSPSVAKKNLGIISQQCVLVNTILYKTVTVNLTRTGHSPFLSMYVECIFLHCTERSSSAPIRSRRKSFVHSRARVRPATPNPTHLPSAHFSPSSAEAASPRLNTQLTIKEYAYFQDKSVVPSTHDSQ